jgi:hypothetical protein
MRAVVRLRHGTLLTNRDLLDKQRRLLLLEEIRLGDGKRGVRGIGAEGGRRVEGHHLILNMEGTYKCKAAAGARHPGELSGPDAPLWPRNEFLARSDFDRPKVRYPSISRPL